MGIGIIKNNSCYKDITHGDYGFMVWFLPISILFFFYIELMALYLLWTTSPSITEDYLMMIFGFFVITAVIFLFGSSALYALQTVQFIEMRGGGGVIRLYFCKKICFSTNELSDIREFKINKLMSQIRTFPLGGTGFFICLKNKKKYRVSPNMEGFLELKSLLDNIVDANMEHSPME